jgi:hypothetical protein
MLGMALLGILSWIVSGLIRDGTAWFAHPPLYFVIVTPFLFAAAITFLVTYVQFQRETAAAPPTIIGSQSSPTHRHQERNE